MSDAHPPFALADSVNTQNCSDEHASLADDLFRLATRSKGARTPALSFAVMTTSGLAACGAAGTADLQHKRVASVDDQFPWFSMTKIATATAATRLAHSGHVDLNAPISIYLGERSWGKHGAPTVSQLLTHTAGLGNPMPIRWVRPLGQPPNPQLVSSVVCRHGQPGRAPGGPAAYSNIGYLLAGQVLEAVTGTSVEQVITNVVLRPLGMSRTGFTFDLNRPRATGYIRTPRPLRPLLARVLPHDIVGPHIDGYTSFRPFLVEGPAYGGLVGPAADAARLALAHLPQGALDAPMGPLGDLTAMSQIQHPGKPFDHGIGWFRKPADAPRIPAFVEHYGTGGGFWNAMRIYPNLGVAVVGMTNNTSAWPFDDFFSAVVQLISNRTSSDRS
jgi:CubicO group peptidase (beta-lactamase class C family)